MKWCTVLAVLTLCAMLTAPALSAGGDLTSRPAAVPDKVAARAIPFALHRVRLLDGPFKHAQDIQHKFLLEVPLDPMLYPLRREAGLPSPVKNTDDLGWPATGHFAGHFLSACALMYQSTGDEELKKKADRVVAVMAECQDKIGSGYIGGFPERSILELEKRINDPSVRATVPWYCLHKIYAGLLDMYTLTGNRQALAVLEKAADWIIANTDALTEQQMQDMLNTEHGGMNEVLANLYAATGKEKYLKVAQRFNHRAILDPFITGQDSLENRHANTQIPKFTGVARQYELTANPDLKAIATGFWNVVTRERSYVTGGNSHNEHFSPKAHLSDYIQGNTCESCNSYNMLKLTRRLFSEEPKAEYADYYERTLLNHILAAQHPETGGQLYFHPVGTGAVKGGWSHPGNMTFSCCAGTGVESHSKYGDSIYFHDGKNGLFVNLFIASVLTWKEQGVVIRQETSYPDQGSTRLLFTCEKSVALTINVRHPWWAVAGFDVRVNGERQPAVSEPGSYASVRRTWKSGDLLEISMPFSFRFEAFRDNADRAAILYGPMVMCAWTTRDNAVAVLRGSREDAIKALKPVPGEANVFTAPASLFRTSLEEVQGDVTFVPFYKEYKKPYAIYWEAYDDARWAAREAAMKAEKERRRIWEARRVDGLEFVDAEERAHNLQGERTAAGDHRGRRWRHCDPTGWFSVDVKVLPDQPQVLACGYWGSDRNRKFDVLVDGQKIATQELKGEKPDVFFDREYPLPAELLKGKTKITVRFQPADNLTAGGVFGCYVMKTASE